MASSAPSQTVGSALALGLVAHQVFRKYETFEVGVHAALLLLPPIVLSVTSSPPQWTLAHALYVNLATYLATLVSSIIIYRLSPVHPLARYPGPLGCKLTKFWMGAMAIPGFQHKYIKSLHDRYGDVVRIGPNEVSIRDPSVLNALLGPSGAPKGPHFVGRVLSDRTLPIVGIMDTEVHMQRRRNWARGMNPAAIKEYEPFIARRAQQLMDRLEGLVGKEVVIGKWFNFFTYDFMCDMAFGGGTEMIAAGHDEGNTWALLDEAVLIATFFGHVPWLGVYIGKIPAATGNLIVLLNNCAERTKARLARGSEKKDLFHYLNSEDLPDKPSTPVQQLIDDGVLAIVAGSDTTSAALTGVVYSLLTHPDVYEKLQEEIDKFCPPGEDALSTQHHRDMPYLAAVIKETLRVLPPVPGGSQRRVSPTGPSLVAGNIVLPPGTVFWPHVYSHHHDVRSFSPYTSEFWPERWLLASGSLPSSRGVTPASAEFRHNEAAFLPFSAGPLNCVGKGLALQEMRMVLCAFLQRFRVHMRPGWDPGEYEREFRDYFTSPRPDLPVVLEMRR